eukprot:gene19496-biopygen4020
MFGPVGSCTERTPSVFFLDCPQFPPPCGRFEPVARTLGQRRGAHRQNSPEDAEGRVNTCSYLTGICPKRRNRKVGCQGDRCVQGETARGASGTRPGRARFFKFYRVGRVRDASAAVSPRTAQNCAFHMVL